MFGRRWPDHAGLTYARQPADRVGKCRAIVFRDNAKITPGEYLEQALPCSVEQTRSASGVKIMTSARLRELRPGGRVLDKETERAVRAFMRLIEEKYHPIEALVYGSRARGTHRPDSDADIAVILRGRRGDRYKALGPMSDAAYDVMMETGIHIQPLPLWEAELKRPELFSNPALIENIKREGLRL